MKAARIALALVFSVVAPLPGSSAPKIGVLLRDKDIFYGAVEKGAVERASSLGVELIVKAPLTANQLSQQLAMLAALEKEQIDALVASPLTVDEFKEPLARLSARGVKIVILETVFPEGTAHAYLGYNQVEMGQTAARLLLERTPEGAEVAMLRANSLERVSLREKTILNMVRELRPNIVMHADVMAGSTHGDDYQMLGVLFQKHPNIKSLCTPFSASTKAGIKFIKEKGLAGTVVHVGFGTGLSPEAVEALESGAMQVWIAQQPKLFGVKGVEAAVDLISGKPVPAVVDVPYYIVTKANLHEPEIEGLRNL
jgi:ABC-type sugar transport system substrate-binding protein